MLFVICDSHRLVAVVIVCFFNTPGCTISFMNSPNFLLVISKYHWKTSSCPGCYYRYDESGGGGRRQNDAEMLPAVTSTYYTILRSHTVPNELIFRHRLVAKCIYDMLSGAACLQIQRKDSRWSYSVERFNILRNELCVSCHSVCLSVPTDMRGFQT